MRAISGSTSASRPVASRSWKARRAWPSVSILVSSSRTRSRLTACGFGGEAADGGGGAGVELEAEAGGEADAADHAEVVFFEAGVGLADGAHDAGVEVGQAADKINHSGVPRPRHVFVVVTRVGSLIHHPSKHFVRVKQQPVDGEVAALDVLLGAGGVADRIGMTAIRISAV